MNCAKCGSSVTETELFCGNCGTPLKAVPASIPASATRLQQPGSTQGSGRLVIVAALLLGLLAGAGVFIWRMRSHAAPEAPVQVKAQEQPPPVASAPIAENPSGTAKPTVKPTARRARGKKSSPVEEPAPLVASKGPPSPEPTPEVPPVPSATPYETKRKAVQENDTLTGPTSSPDSTSPETIPEPREAAPSNAPLVSPAAKYNGPLYGVATWTGKLEKGQVLTITGGTPSMGVLSGSGLPGVPVHITVDQTNLGFAVMPNASNGYLTVALKSHAKHAQITMHWSVVQ